MRFVGRVLAAAVIFAFFLGGAVGQAQKPLSVTDPHVLQLADQLRCLVCQNQTVAESNAALATDFKKQIAEMLAAGKSDEDIIRFMVDRYGDFVLYKPPVKSTTWILWFGPIAFLVVAAAITARRVVRQSPAPVEMDAENQARATSLLSRVQVEERQ